MTKQIPQPRELPPWLTTSISVVVVLHLGAIIFLVLAASSGPWLINFGPIPSSDALGPPFATTVNQVTANYYLRPLQMTHNYHFLSNRAGEPGVRFEAKIRDEDGNVIETVEIPDQRANFWVWHRQKLLAQGIYQDQMVQRSGTEKIEAPDKKASFTKYYWNPSKDGGPMTLLARSSAGNPPEEVQLRPTAWSLVLAKSYMRYLRDKYDAKSVDLYRHTRQGIRPELMLTSKQQAEQIIKAGLPEETAIFEAKEFGQ